MTLPTSAVGSESITTIKQQFYNVPLPPITLELLDLASLTAESVSDLIATLGDDTRLGIAASYGEKSVLETLAFSTESRVLLILINPNSKQATRQKQILTNQLLCNAALEKHGFFIERIAAGLHLDLGLRLCNAFDIASSGDKRGSKASYKAVIARGRTQYPVNQSIVEKFFAEQPFILSRANLFALRAWACFVGVQGLPTKPGMIDTSIKALKARSKNFNTLFSLSDPPPPPIGAELDV